MPKKYTPGLYDRLMGTCAVSGDAAFEWSLEQFKDAIARDLEALLNTRMAIVGDELAPFPECLDSIVNYGLIDVAAMCLTNSDDQEKICRAVQSAIERHEPRLYAVRASLRVRGTSINRIDFVISARLRAQFAGEAVQFDAVLKPSSQQYAISKATPTVSRSQ